MLIEIAPHTVFYNQRFVEPEFTGVGPLYCFNCQFYGDIIFTGGFCNAGNAYELHNPGQPYLVMLNCIGYTKGYLPPHQAN